MAKSENTKVEKKKSERQKTDTKASLIKTKNIIKEIIIFLLLTLAIILVLGVVLYQYVPTNKIIPETVSYTTPEKVKAELQTDENVDTSEVVVTYQIDSTDLSNYKRINEYVSGRKNPFASTGTQVLQVEQQIHQIQVILHQLGSSNSNSGTSSSEHQVLLETYQILQLHLLDNLPVKEQNKLVINIII